MDIRILTPEEQHERDLQQLKAYRPIDDDFMRELFRKNLPLAQFVLRIITGIEDLVLTDEETQYDMKRLVGARSICLDVFGRDSKNRRFNLEVQRADSGARPKRARYHSSAMDVEFLDKKQEFEELPITYTIFITENDVFNTGNPIYPIERINMTTGKPFDDDEHILYVNGAYVGDSNLGKLVHDLLCRDVDEMHFDVLKKRVSQFKDSEEGRRIMCKAVEEFAERRAAASKAEGRAEGKAEGRRETMLATAKRMLKSGMLTLKDIAKFSGLSLAQVQKLQASMA